MYGTVYVHGADQCPTLPGVGLTPRFAKGPQEVLRAVRSADPADLTEALDFQRESFRAALGCYPEQCEVVAYEDLPPNER